MNDILIIGNCAVDVIGAPIDEYPPVGGLRTFERLEMSAGGCAVNVAMALGRLGVSCDLVTRIGEDPLGSFVAGELEACGVDTGGLVIDSEASTGFTFVTVTRDGLRSFFHCRGTNDNLQRADLKPGCLDGRRVVMVSGAMAMRVLDGAQTAEVLAAARQAGAATVLDTVYVDGLPPTSWLETLGPSLPHTDYFAPSLPEARALSGRHEPTEVARHLRDLGARNVVLKVDDRGALVLPESGDPIEVPAFPVRRVVDTTGAGDCFCAGLISGLVDGTPLPDAARRANAVAARSIRRMGATTGVPTLDELRSYMADSNPTSSADVAPPQDSPETDR